MTFPASFNPHGLEIWITVCSHVAVGLSSREAWLRALREYKEACHDAGLLPFEPQSQGDIDQVVRHYLQVRRSNLVHFLNRTKLLRGVRAWKKDVTATREGHGFVLQTTLGLDIPDPKWERQLFHLHPYRFSLMRREHAWAARIDPGLTISVATYNRTSPRSWSVTSSIECPLYVDPGNVDFQQYVITQLWKPILGTRSFYDDRVRRL